MHMYRRWLPVFLVWLICPAAWSWSANGHGDIAIAALERLPKSAQQEYQQILAAGPWAKGGASWRSHAARAAAWPDRVRDMPLRKVFGQYGSGKVPGALQPYRKHNTSDWHYTNALFIDSAGRVVEATTAASTHPCPPARDGQLLRVWPSLFTAYEQSRDPRDKAIVLAFLLHLVADAYQPLHLMGSLDANCRHDRGGNAFCVAPVVGFKAGLRCRDSLHFLWDQGFGAFAEKLPPARRFRGDARDLSAAVTAVRRIAPEVYPQKPEQSGSDIYRNRSRRQVEEMAQRASAHLVAALGSLTRD